MNTNATYILNRDGQVIWKRGLGATFADTAPKATEYTNAVASAAAKLNPSGGSQTEIGAVSKTVQKTAGLAAGLVTVGAPLLLTPPGLIIAGIIVGVLGIVAGAAALVDAIFGSSKDKETLEQARQYDQLNNVLRQQIQQTDSQTVAVGNGLEKLNSALKSVGLAGIEIQKPLGNVADDTLRNAMANNDELKKALALKTDALRKLIDTFNQSVEKTYTAVTGKSVGSKYVLWTLLGTAMLGGAYLAYKKLTHQKI